MNRAVMKQGRTARDLLRLDIARVAVLDRLVWIDERVAVV
jgi:hypothetical protein